MQRNDLASGRTGLSGYRSVLARGRIVLIADTLVHEWPDENDLADIAERGAEVARMLGLDPRVAFLSFSTFGYPRSERAEKMHLAPNVLERRGVDFTFGDGKLDNERGTFICRDATEDKPQGRKPVLYKKSEAAKGDWHLALEKTEVTHQPARRKGEPPEGMDSLFGESAERAPGGGERGG